MNRLTAISITALIVIGIIITIDTVKYLNNFDIQGIKIHSLFILKNTPLGDLYTKEKFNILSLEEYVDITTEQLALLDKDIVIHRINGDAPKNDLIEPTWSIKKLVVMNEIDKELVRRGSYQGVFVQYTQK